MTGWRPHRIGPRSNRPGATHAALTAVAATSPAVARHAAASAGSRRSAVDAVTGARTALATAIGNRDAAPGRSRRRAASGAVGEPCPVCAQEVSAPPVLAARGPRGRAGVGGRRGAGGAGGGARRRVARERQVAQLLRARGTAHPAAGRGDGSSPIGRRPAPGGAGRLRPARRSAGAVDAALAELDALAVAATEGHAGGPGRASETRAAAGVDACPARTRGRRLRAAHRARDPLVPLAAVVRRIPWPGGPRLSTGPHRRCPKGTRRSPAPSVRRPRPPHARRRGAPRPVRPCLCGPVDERGPPGHGIVRTAGHAQRHERIARGAQRAGRRRELALDGVDAGGGLGTRPTRHPGRRICLRRRDREGVQLRQGSVHRTGIVEPAWQTGTARHPRPSANRAACRHRVPQLRELRREPVALLGRLPFARHRIRFGAERLLQRRPAPRRRPTPARPRGPRAAAPGAPTPPVCTPGTAPPPPAPDAARRRDRPAPRRPCCRSRWPAPCGPRSRRPRPRREPALPRRAGQPARAPSPRRQ